MPSTTTQFYHSVKQLISEGIPAQFPNLQTHDFLPHITLTSGIDKSLYGNEPQIWLDSLSVPATSAAHPLVLKLEALEAGEPFVKKFTARLSKLPEILKLAEACRAEAVTGGNFDKAREWAQEQYLPHMSLL